MANQDIHSRVDEIQGLDTETEGGVFSPGDKDVRACIEVSLRFDEG